MGAVSSIRVYNSTWQLIGFRHVISGSLALASLNHTCRNLVPTFPQRSPPSLLTTAACGGLRSTPDCRTRRAFLHLRTAVWTGVTRDTMPCMDGARGAREKNLTFRETIRVQPCIRPLQHVPTAMNRDSQDTPEVRV